MRIVDTTDDEIGSVLSLASLNGANGFRLDGVAAFDLSGRVISAAGDVNGDGFDDLLVGAVGADPNANGFGSGSGSTYVVFGQATGFTANINLDSLNGTSQHCLKLDGGAVAVAVAL